ncbi:MAG: glycosyltransferase [Chloroflexia bacterium]
MAESLGEVRSPSTVHSHRVDIIIPTYNGLALLTACLEALRGQVFRDFAVLVVDDGSSDGTAEVLARSFPRCGCCGARGTRGWRRRATRGSRRRVELVCLLNNDTEAEPGWLGALVAALDGAPGAGSAASKMLLFDRRDTLHSAGDGFAVTGVPVNRGVWRRDSGQYDGATEIFGPCAGAALYRRSALAAGRSDAARGSRLTKICSCTARMSI